MELGTIIKIEELSPFGNVNYIYYYQLREGKFKIDIDMYPGFPGYYAEFEGKYFYCLGAIFPNPHAWSRKGEIEGLNLLKRQYEIVTDIPEQIK